MSLPAWRGRRYSTNARQSSVVIALGTGRHAGQLVARLLHVGFGKNLAKIGKLKSFGHGNVQRIHALP